MAETRDVVVVGAGIIGIATAAYLCEAGHDVTLIDSDGVCEGTSSGNAAALAFPEILPLAQKGMIKNLPRWLADPLGPLSVPVAYLPSLAPWLLRFWKAGFSGNRNASINAQASLMQLAETEWMALMERSGTLRMLREFGALELYESEAEFNTSLSGWEEREKAGIAYRHLRGSELSDLQPGLSDRFVAGTFMPGWKNVADPKLLSLAIWQYCLDKKVRFEKRNVETIASDPDGPQVRYAGGQVMNAGKVVLAAGAWSHKLARQLGDIIPLETERGYNTTLPVDAFDLRLQLIFPAHGFVVTPLDTGIRVGGAVELAGLKRPPNYARSKAMLKKAKRFLPDLDTRGGTEWMGYRPSLPDSLPVISRSSPSPDILYAFGHGHLGLTQAAATGRLICDMIGGQATEIDIGPFSAKRF